MHDPPKVLHIVENLHRGAVENWLVRMLRYGVEQGIKLNWTFYCIIGASGQLDEEVVGMGGKVVFSPVPIGSKLLFMKSLRTELRSGKYDIVHCHHDLVSAVYLIAACGLPIKKRLVHIHNSDESVLTSNRTKQLILRPLMRRVCLLLADRIVGISKHTLAAFLAGRTPLEARDILHYYGIDPGAFVSAEGDRERFRRALGLPRAAKVLLFAGRVVDEKNPLFAVDVLAEMNHRDPSVVGVFVGVGSLDSAVKSRIAELGLDHCFRHLGWRLDIPNIMCCCDWFILPRPEFPMEGLGIAVIEAQLAGLRLLLSKGISDDALLPSSNAVRLPLALGASQWADKGLAMLRNGQPTRGAALDALAASPFAMDTAMTHLLTLHR